MKLPKDPEERKKAAKFVAKLLQLTPAQRRKIIQDELRHRGLEPL
jgi:hypothetical protein